MQFLRVFDDICDKAIRFTMVRSGLSFILLTLLTIGLFYSNITTLPQFDRDEAAFALQVQSFFTKQNLFHFENTNYIGLLGYWLHIPFIALLGDDSISNIIAYRTVSLMGGVLLIISTFLLGRRIFGREAGLVAAILTVIPLIFQHEIIFSGTTTLLSAVIIINLYALACLWRRDMMGRDAAFSNRHFFTFWLSLIFATLISAMSLFFILIPMIGLSIVKNDIEWLAPLQIHFGAIISAIIILPPLLVISHLSDLSLLKIFFGTENLSSLIDTSLYAENWPLQYLTGHIIWGWPVILLSPIALFYSFKNRSDDRFTFGISVLFLLWVFAEIAPIKTLWFGLILTVFASVIIAGTFVKFINDDYQMPKGIFLISITLYMFISLCLAVKIPYISHFLTENIDPLLTLCAILSLGIAILNVIMLSQNLMHGIVAGLLLQIAILFGYFNNVTSYNFDVLDIPNRLEKAIARTGCPASALYISGYDHPALSFKFNQNITMLSAEEMNIRYKNATPCSIFIVGENHKDFIASGNSSELITVLDIKNYQTIMLEVYKR